MFSVPMLTGKSQRNSFLSEWYESQGWKKKAYQVDEIYHESDEIYHESALQASVLFSILSFLFAVISSFTYLGYKWYNSD